MTADEIKNIRAGLGFSQVEFARALGVSFTTVNRWENGKATPQGDRITRIQDLAATKQAQSVLGYEIHDAIPATLNFEGDPEAIKLVVDAHRLRNGHQFNKAFGLELSRVVPLPHQRVAVYESMLPQNPLRFLLADDAGAGQDHHDGALYPRNAEPRAATPGHHLLPGRVDLELATRAAQLLRPGI